jgi:hypothetical protein
MKGPRGYQGILRVPRGIFKGYIGNLKVTKMLLRLPRIPLGLIRGYLNYLEYLRIA